MSKHPPRETYNDIEGLFKALIHGRVEVVLFSKLGAELMQMISNSQPEAQNQLSDSQL